MKKILFLLLALFTLTVSATPLPNDTATEQLPDSVYVVAYFCKNDTLEYIYSNEQIKIKGTDTTTTIITEGKFRLVVLDSTATGYRIQYDQLEIGSPLTDKLKELANDKNNLIESISSLINDTSNNIHHKRIGGNTAYRELAGNQKPAITHHRITYYKHLQLNSPSQ